MTPDPSAPQAPTPSAATADATAPNPEPSDATSSLASSESDAGIASARPLEPESGVMPGAGGMAGPEGRAELVPQAHGGALWRGGPPGGHQAGSVAQLSAIKRKARRHVDALLDRVAQVAEKGFAVDPATGQSIATSAQAKTAIDAIRLLNTIAEPTAAEEKDQNPSAQDAADLWVRSQAPDPRPRPEAKTQRRVPSADPNLPSERPTPRGGKGAPSGAKVVGDGKAGVGEAFGVVGRRKGPRE